MNFNDVFDFDDDEYFECSEFDRQIDEFKQALIVNAREEIKDKIVALEEEVKSLRMFRDDRKMYLEKLAAAERRAVLAETEAQKKYKDARLKELLGDNLVTTWEAKGEWVQGPKCDLCDEKRLRHFITPCGREMAESCTCAKSTLVYKPRELMLYRIHEWRGGMELFYDSVKCKTENESDYRRRAVARSGCDFEKVNPYDSSFESEELCEEYCEWKNKKESCK